MEIQASQAFGTNPSRGGKIPVDGPWLDGSHSHVYGKKWRTYGKESDVIDPAPSNLFVILDEDERSINDAGFATVGPSTPLNYQMIDWPATYHNMAAGMSFADGHSEIHKWVDPRTKVGRAGVGRANQKDSKDIEWMAVHASALIHP